MRMPCASARCAWGMWGMGALQYPGEKEITFPPYTCLETHGDARVERDAKGNEVVIFPLKVRQTPVPKHPSPPHKASGTADGQTEVVRQGDG